jgi:hypothetical protein
MKKTSPYYVFMTPFFEKGDALAIEAAKKEYFKLYKANWRKQFRVENKEIATSWTKQEYKELENFAKEHKLPITQYIKQATIAYGNKRYIVPDKKVIQKGIQYLAMTYNTIEQIEEKEKLNLRDIKITIDQLEKQLRETILSPYTIEQSIDMLLAKEPELKQYLLTYITSK